MDTILPQLSLGYKIREKNTKQNCEEKFRRKTCKGGKSKPTEKQKVKKDGDTRNGGIRVIGKKAKRKIDLKRCEELKKVI